MLEYFITINLLIFNKCIFLKSLHLLTFYSSFTKYITCDQWKAEFLKTQSFSSVRRIKPQNINYSCWYIRVYYCYFILEFTFATFYFFFLSWCLFGWWIFLSFGAFLYQYPISISIILINYTCFNVYISFLLTHWEASTLTIINYAMHLRWFLILVRPGAFKIFLPTGACLYLVGAA